MSSLRAEQTTTTWYEIDAVEVRDLSARGAVETPVAGEHGDTRVLTLSGWVVGGDGPVQAVHAWAGERKLWELPAHDRRPDIAARHPDAEWALQAGFSGALGLLRLPTRWTLDLTVDGGMHRSFPLATVHGRRAPLQPAEHTLNPLTVTTLGRTGSSWLVHVLGRHPEVIAYRP